MFCQHIFWLKSRMLLVTTTVTNKSYQKHTRDQGSYGNFLSLRMSPTVIRKRFGLPWKNDKIWQIFIHSHVSPLEFISYSSFRLLFCSTKILSVRTWKQNKDNSSTSCFVHLYNPSCTFFIVENFLKSLIKVTVSHGPAVTHNLCSNLLS